MNPDSPSSIRSESPIPSNPASPISVDDEFSRILDPDREYQPPRFEVMSNHPHDHPDLMDTGDSYQMRAILDARLLIEKNKFDSFVDKCVENCIKRISDESIIIPTRPRQRDITLMEIVARASEPSGFFGHVVFVDILTDILTAFEHVNNRDYSITFILEGYYTAVFEEASRYLLRNAGNSEYTFGQICRQTSILVVVRKLVNLINVDSPLREFTYFGKARRESIKTVNKEIKYLLSV
jgi:hypothetical protein